MLLHLFITIFVSFMRPSAGQQKKFTYSYSKIFICNLNVFAFSVNNGLLYYIGGILFIEIVPTIVDCLARNQTLKNFSHRVNKPPKSARQTTERKTDTQTENKEELNIVNF